MSFFWHLFQYIRNLFLKGLSVVFLCFCIIFVLFDFVEIQRQCGGHDISLVDKLSVVLLRFPHFFEEISSLLVFIAALYLFWRLNRNHELVICRSAGLSLWRIVSAVSLLAICIGCIDLMVVNPFSSVFFARADKLSRKLQGMPMEDIRVESTGIWLSEQRGSNQAIYRAGHLDLANLTFRNLSVIITSPHYTFLERIDATEAQIQGDNLILRAGWHMRAGRVAQPFKEFSIKTSLSQEWIEKMNVDRHYISFWKLPSYISLLNVSGLKSLKYQMTWHFLLAKIAWLGVMVLLAAAFTCTPVRQGKSILMVAIGVVVGLSLVFFNHVMFSVGLSGYLPPIIAAWLPPLLTLMVGATLVFNQEDG